MQFLGCKQSSLFSPLTNTFQATPKGMGGSKAGAWIAQLIYKPPTQE
jgi:hypothetical protein